jgi:Cu-Zn family superoxide dismutase
MSKAVSVLAPNDNGVAGVVRFTQDGNTLHIDYDITGLTNGEHGFHIHTYGDLTDGCDSACAHFNPDGTNHGGLDSKVRHLGDLGNIASKNMVSQGRISTTTLSLDMKKRNCIVGRMIIVHADRDDLGEGGDAESLKTGNAGKRVGCGVIGLAESSESNDKGNLAVPIGAVAGAVMGWYYSNR